MKALPRITLVTLVTILSATTLFAQHNREHKRMHKPDKEKFKTMKIAYLTEKLSLTSAEAEKFWPVYNEYSEKKMTIYKEFRKDRKEMMEDQELTDAEAEKAVNDRIIVKQKELDLEKEYLTQFKSVLPIQKVGLLYRAEENFKKDLLRKMRAPTAPTPPTPPTPEK